VKEEAAGKMAKCPGCGHVVQVPTFDTLILLPPSEVAAVQGQGLKATSGFGIAGLVLGLLACPTAWIPLVGFLTIPISVLGMGFASVGILVSAIGKRTRLEMPIAAAVVSFVALLLALWPVIVVGTVAAPAVKEAVEEARKQARTESSEHPLESAQPLRAASEQPLQFIGRLEAGDPQTSQGRHYKVHEFIAQEGQHLVLDMMSSDFDAYLVLHSPSGRVFENDDGGVGHNARLDITADRSGRWVVWARSCNPREFGQYTVTVQVASRGIVTPFPVSPTEGPRAEPPRRPQPAEVAQPETEKRAREEARARLLPRFEAATNQNGLLLVFNNLQAWRTSLQVNSKDASRFSFSGTGVDESVLPSKDLKFSGRVDEKGNLLLDLSNRSGELVFDVFLDTGAFSTQRGGAALTPMDAAMCRQIAEQRERLARILSQTIPDPVVTLYDGKKPADLKKINSLKPSFAAAEVSDTRALLWVDGRLDTYWTPSDIGTYTLRYKEPPKTRSIGLALHAGMYVPTVSVTVNGQGRIPLPSWDERYTDRTVWIILQLRDMIELVELRFDVLAERLPLCEIVMLGVEAKTAPPGGKSDSRAASQLNLARAFLRNGLTEKATTILRSIVSDYPGTTEAEQAQKELDNIKQAPKEETQPPAAGPESQSR
jgi:hypothetical protein